MKLSARDCSSLLPLKPDVFTVLLALAEGDSHGYAIMQAAEARSGTRGALQPGSLYRLLRNMLDGDLVQQLDRREVPDGSDERRRYYRITPFGRTVAAAESRRMAELLQVSRRLDLVDEADLAR